MKVPIEAELPLVLVAAAIVLGGAACASGRSGRTASAHRTIGSTPMVLHTGGQQSDGQISLLARAFLPSSAKAHSGFAYYGYLIFTDSSPASAFARRAASKCYLDMLTRVKQVGENSGVRRESMAVLYLPLKDNAVAETLIKERDPQSLIATYDYVRAHTMAAQLKRAGRTIPGVAIIGSTRPLGADGASGPVDVVDLTDPGTVVERMEHFRSSLDARAQQVNEGGQPVVLKRLREYFAWAESSGRNGPTQLTF